MTRRTTIEDVAKLAGVSKVTVSYVLNGQGAAARISEPTERRVLAAAAELGYQKNALARMLVTRKTDTLALVFQYASYFSAPSAFITEVMRGVCEGCTEAGLDLMLHTRPVGEGDEASLLMDGRVEGALVLRDAHDPTVETLLRLGFPTVLFFSRPLDGDAAFVDADNYTGGRIAVRHLVQLGHRRIGMVRGPRQSVSSNGRFDGFRQEMDAAGLRVRDEDVLTIEHPGADYGPLTERMRQPDRPTGLFVWSDDVAFGCLPVLEALGLSVPQDVSLVGFDSSELCTRANPPLTSVRQPVFEMAKEATLLLSALLRHDDSVRKQVVYSLSLDIRGSTCPPDLHSSRTTQ